MNERLIPLLLDIEDDLEQDLSLGALASRFGASEFHFHRTFSETVGETPKKHIERLRLEKAAMQLAVSDTPVTDLAFSLGFRNLETFSRRFKNAAERKNRQNGEQPLCHDRNRKNVYERI